MMLLHNYIV